MQCTLSKEVFLLMLKQAELCVGGKQAPFPVMQHVLVEVSGTNVSIESNVLDRGLSTDAIGSDPEDGVACLDFSDFLFAVETAPAKSRLTLVAHEGESCATLTFLHENRATIAQIDPTEFPRVPRYDESVKRPSFLTRRAELLESYEQVLPAVSSDETRPMYHSVSHQFSNDNENRMLVIGADAFQLTKSEVDGRHLHANDVLTECNVDLLSMQMLVKLLAKSNALHVQIIPMFEQKQILFFVGRTAYSVHSIECTYPDWRSMLKNMSEGATSFDADIEELRNCVAAVSKYARSNFHKMQMLVNDGQVHFKARRDTGAFVVRTLTSAHVTGPNLTFTCNTLYLESFVKNARSNALRFQFGPTWGANGVNTKPLRIDLLQRPVESKKRSKNAAVSYQEVQHFVMPLDGPSLD